MHLLTGFSDLCKATNSVLTLYHAPGSLLASMGHVDLSFWFLVLHEEIIIFLKPLTLCTSGEYGLVSHTFGTWLDLTLWDNK